MRAAITWPRLISLWAAATGLAIGAFPADLLLHHRGFSQPYPQKIAALLAVAAVVGFILLSFFLYLARPWARRALVVMLLCFVLAILIFIISTDWRYVSHDYTRIAVYIIVLVPPLFVLGVLFQPDVVRAFPPKHPLRSNGAWST